MATEGTPTSTNSGAATGKPGPAALLVATALGSLVGAKIGRAPLAVAAGAAVVALMRRSAPTGKRPSTELAQALPTPIYPPAPSAAPLDSATLDPRIEDWLARQFAREKESAGVEILPAPASEEVLPESGTSGGIDIATDESAQSSISDEAQEEDYFPEPLLPEPAAAETEWSGHSFATLTEPAVQSADASPAPELSVPAWFHTVEQDPTPPTSSHERPQVAAPAFPPIVWPAAAALFQEEPFKPAVTAPAVPPPEADAPRPVFTTSASPTLQQQITPTFDTAPIPGIEPLPSWTEPPQQPAASSPAIDFNLESLFTSPAAKIEVPQQVFTHAPAWADVSQVPVASETAWAPPPVSETPAQPPSQEDPMAALFKAAEPGKAFFSPFQDSPVASDDPPAREIAVHVAAEGEAWFDSPLAGVPNPWAPPKIEEDNGISTPVTPAKPLATTPVVDAEILLRPRAPVQASVISKHAAQATEEVNPPVEPSAESLPPSSPEIPRAPLQSPREQKARSTWRSWWRGD